MAKVSTVYVNNLNDNVKSWKVKELNFHDKWLLIVQLILAK
jgi:hypothetical protein